jgi:hypothetical protein
LGLTELLSVSCLQPVQGAEEQRRSLLLPVRARAVPELRTTSTGCRSYVKGIFEFFFLSFLCTIFNTA